MTMGMGTASAAAITNEAIWMKQMRMLVTVKNAKPEQIVETFDFLETLNRSQKEALHKILAKYGTIDLGYSRTEWPSWHGI